MNTVHLVTTGTYSDYRVIAAYTSRKLAKEAAAMMGDNYHMETIDLHDALPSRIVIHTIQCNLWDDGTADGLEACTRTEWDHDALWPEHVRPVGTRWVRAPIHGGRGGRLEVVGTDEQRVQQQFSDMRAALMSDPALRAKREFKR